MSGGKWSRSATPADERRRKAATFVAILQMQTRDERAACEAQRNNPCVGHGGQRFFHHWELLWPAGRKFRDRLADFDWIKRVHKIRSLEFEPGKLADNDGDKAMPDWGQFLTGLRLRTNRGRGQFAFVESSRLRTGCGQSMKVTFAC